MSTCRVPGRWTRFRASTTSAAWAPACSSPPRPRTASGYSEPFRRFVQHESFTPQVNEIENQMPSWIPGEDHLINFRKGDSYIKVDEGYARLPGAGYEALHPELEGVDPEDYPDITKLSILGDVAPYSREYNRIRAVVEKQTHGNPDLRAPGPLPTPSAATPTPLAAVPYTAADRRHDLIFHALELRLDVSSVPWAHERDIVSSSPLAMYSSTVRDSMNSASLSNDLLFSLSEIRVIPVAPYWSPRCGH